MTQQKIDEIVAQINQGISEASQLVRDEKIPDFSMLDTKITEFSDILSNLPAEQQKEYTPLLKAWAEEIKKVSDILDDVKNKVADQLSTANSGAKAMGAYGATSKLIKP